MDLIYLKIKIILLKDIGNKENSINIVKWMFKI